MGKFSFDLFRVAVSGKTYFNAVWYFCHGPTFLYLSFVFFIFHDLYICFDAILIYDAFPSNEIYVVFPLNKLLKSI